MIKRVLRRLGIDPTGEFEARIKIKYKRLVQMAAAAQFKEAGGPEAGEIKKSVEEAKKKKDAAVAKGHVISRTDLSEYLKKERLWKKG